ncbi:MAG: FtsX-like permease family protein [Planctomycetes bacterium]|nr:FtsX-like permease family protein [Planctomycetota bacterium]
MRFLVTLRIAVRALRKNKMRAALTILGVVIGIAAVTTMVSIGQSASQLVQGQFEALGTNVIVILPGSRRGAGGVSQRGLPTLTAGDSDAIAEECESVLASSPIVGTGGQAIYGNSNWSSKQIQGVGRDYLLVRNWGLRSGGFFTERDIDSGNKVCVIGHTIVAKLFQTQNPIDEIIRIRNIPLRVIGILDKKGANMVGEDQDDIILIPYTTVRKRIEGTSFENVHAILVSARSVTQMATAQSEIQLLLADRHRIQAGQPADFQVQNTTEIANVLQIITGTLTAMLAAIAGVSLVVGGVGIMNIMLVSVTERTREIGIRMAVGARSTDILRQFLVESVLLSCIGGALGCALGIGASTGITVLINQFTTGTKWPIVVSIPAAVIAILFSSAVGVFFGYYPARKASRLDPIDALRYE